MVLNKDFRPCQLVSGNYLLGAAFSTLTAGVTAGVCSVLNLPVIPNGLAQIAPKAFVGAMRPGF